MDARPLLIAIAVCAAMAVLGAILAGGYLVLPVAAFEIILLPFWLLFRGFKTPEAP
jgi:hypothetical protein